MAGGVIGALGRGWRLECEEKGSGGDSETEHRFVGFGVKGRTRGRRFLTVPLPSGPGDRLTSVFHLAKHGPFRGEKRIEKRSDDDQKEMEK